MRQFDCIAPIIAQAQQVKEVASLKEEVLHFKNEQEYIYYITHRVNNIRHNDGRIYLKMKDGVMLANSVSPYAEKFLDNIEEKIKPLVLAFHNKRYLTYSSCMGHDYTYRRYVGLAFCSEESRQYVADEIKKLKIFGVKTVFLDTVCNNNVMMDERTQKPMFFNMTEKQKIEKDIEVKNLNIQFHRKYENYYFLEVIVLDKINFKYEGFLKEISKMFNKLIKHFLWDKLTNKLVEHINSSDFKKYPY